ICSRRGLIGWRPAGTHLATCSAAHTPRSRSLCRRSAACPDDPVTSNVHPYGGALVGSALLSASPAQQRAQPAADADLGLWRPLAKEVQRPILGEHLHVTLALAAAPEAQRRGGAADPQAVQLEGGPVL